MLYCEPSPHAFLSSMARSAWGMSSSILEGGASLRPALARGDDIARVSSPLERYQQYHENIYSRLEPDRVTVKIPAEK